MNRITLDKNAKLTGAIFWILFVFLNPLSLFVEIILIAKADPVFVWHGYEFIRDHALTIGVIGFWIAVAALVYKVKEDSE